jgi:hypothetical protein
MPGKKFLHFKTIIVPKQRLPFKISFLHNVFKEKRSDAMLTISPFNPSV